MQVEFDAARDAENIRKHGISLQRACDFDLTSAMVEVDGRENYGEIRWNAIGFVGTNLYAFTFTMRGEVFRAISLRKASRQEHKNYAGFYGDY